MNARLTHTNIQIETKSLRFLLVTLITFIILYSLFWYGVQKYQLVYESREYPMWIHVKNLINTQSEIKQKMILIGDSRAKAGFEPVLSKDNTLNLTVGGSTPIDGYYTLLTFLENNPEPESLVLSYSPLHLTHAVYFWERTVKYNFLPDNQLDEITGNLLKYNDSGIGTKNQLWKYKFLISMYISSVAEGIKKKRWVINKKVKYDLVGSKGHAYFGIRNGTDSLNGEVKEANDFQQSELIHYYFVKLIELAKSKSIKVFWYTMPFNQSSCEKVSPDLVKNFNKYIDRIEIETDINVIKKIQCMDNKYFGDGSHVFSGSKITTNDILLAIE